MRHPILSTITGLVVVVVVALVIPASGQAPKPGPAAKRYTVPKTPWGDPDLQGVWNDATSGASQISFVCSPTQPDSQ